MDIAINNVVNDAIVQEDDQPIVKIVLDDTKLSASVKKDIQEEFENILSLLEFNQYAYEIFRKYYIDGRLYYNVIVDPEAPKDGIKELRYIDARKIRKVREVSKQRASGNVTVPKVETEYYVYAERGFKGKSVTGQSSQASAVKIAKDSVVYVTSGLTNVEGDMILSYLHKALKVLNQLRALEDSLIVYRISRAPERRIFYIDVGNLPTKKAEQYLKDTMTRFKNKLVYDSTTGEIKDDRKFMTMLEDFWLPRREGGRGTEITTLPGGQNLSQIDDIVYFQKNLYRALGVPASRLEEQAFSFGRATEISREEVKFSKFITRLRGKFSQLFIKLLETQLLLKQTCTSIEFEEFRHQIKFKFATDNYIEELKETEIMRDRVSMLRDIDDYAGKYVSHAWIRKKILRQTDEDIEEMDKEILEERDSDIYNPSLDGMSGDAGGAPQDSAPPDQGGGQDQSQPAPQIDVTQEPSQILGKLATRQDAAGLAAKQELAARRSGKK